MIEDIKRRAAHRVKIMQGQLRGIEAMIESEEYCIDIITQSLAIQKSLASLNKLLIENHLKTHVVHMFAEGELGQQQAIEELLKVYEIDGRA